jgi:hypothetical protein
VIFIAVWIFAVFALSIKFKEACQAKGEEI